MYPDLYSAVGSSKNMIHCPSKKKKEQRKILVRETLMLVCWATAYKWTSLLFNHITLNSLVQNHWNLIIESINKNTALDEELYFTTSVCFTLLSVSRKQKMPQNQMTDRIHIFNAIKGRKIERKRLIL